MRVPEFLADRQVAFETVLHPPAFTAQKLARFLRVPGRQVVKSVLLRSPAGFVVAVLPATDQIDLAAVEAILGGSVRLATDAEVATRFGDCEYGALAPFGSLYGLATLLEEAIGPDDTILFESQRHAVAIRMACRDFLRLERPRRCRFTLPRQTPPTQR